MIFLPSKHGFKFSNSFKHGPLVEILGIGIASSSAGMCGGMSYLTVDYFRAKKPIPKEDETPEPETEFFKKIASRHIDSFDLPNGLIKAYTWTSGFLKNLYNKSIDESLPELEKHLKHGPFPVILIWSKTLNPFARSENHVVVAYEVKNNAIKIYDPNFPCENNVEISFSNNEIVHSRDEKSIRGFYCSKYSFKNPD
jgi:hypothetical protein